MVAELIRRQPAATNAVVEEALASGRPPREILYGIARGLLALLTSETHWPQQGGDDLTRARSDTAGTQPDR